MSALMNVTTWGSRVSGGSFRGRGGQDVLFCEMHLDYNSVRQRRKGGVFPGFGNCSVVGKSSLLQQDRVRRFGERGGDPTGWKEARWRTIWR